MQEVENVLESSALPLYVLKLYQCVVAIREKQRVLWYEDFVANMRVRSSVGVLLPRVSGQSDITVSLIPPVILDSSAQGSPQKEADQGRS